jgi:hypothetical protein
MKRTKIQGYSYKDPQSNLWTSSGLGCFALLEPPCVKLYINIKATALTESFTLSNYIGDIAKKGQDRYEARWIKRGWFYTQVLLYDKYTATTYEAEFTNLIGDIIRDRLSTDKFTYQE